MCDLPAQVTFFFKSVCACKGTCKCKPVVARAARSAGPNTNILQRFTLHTQLPNSAKFLPVLLVSVQDSRLNGLVKPIVATSSISLAKKVPWLPGHVPPCTQPFVSGPEAEATVEGGAIETKSVAPSPPPLPPPQGRVGGVWARAVVGGAGEEAAEGEVVVDMAGSADGPWGQPGPSTHRCACMCCVAEACSLSAATTWRTPTSSFA